MEKCDFLRELSAHSLDIEKWLWTAATIFPHVQKLEDITACQSSGAVLADSGTPFAGDAQKANRAAELLIGEPVLDCENQVLDKALQRAACVFNAITRFDLYLALTNYVAAQLLGTPGFFQSDEEFIDLLQYYVGDVLQLAGQLVAVFEAQKPMNGFPHVRKHFKLANSAALYQALVADRQRCADEISMRISLAALQLRETTTEQQINSLAALLKELNQVYFEHKNSLFDCLYGYTVNCALSNNKQQNEPLVEDLAKNPAKAEQKPKKRGGAVSYAESLDLSALGKLLLGGRAFRVSAIRLLVEKLYATFGISFDVKNKFQRSSSLIDEVSAGVRRMREDFPEVFAQESLSQLQSICDCFGLELPGAAAASSLEICAELRARGLATPIRCSIVSNCESVIMFQDVFSLAQRVQEYQELGDIDSQALQSDFLAAFEKLTKIQADSPAHALDRLRLAVSVQPDSYLTASVLNDIESMRAALNRPLYKVDFKPCAAVFQHLVRCSKAALVACPHAPDFVSALACSTNRTRELKLAQFCYQQLTGEKHILYKLSAKSADIMIYYYIFSGVGRLDCAKLLGILGISCSPPYIALEFLLCAFGEKCEVKTAFGDFFIKKIAECVKHLQTRRVVYEFESDCFLCASHLLCAECSDFDDALERCRYECASDYVLRYIAGLGAGSETRAQCLDVLRLFAEMTLASDALCIDLRGYADFPIAQQAGVYYAGAQWLMI